MILSDIFYLLSRIRNETINKRHIFKEMIKNFIPLAGKILKYFVLKSIEPNPIPDEVVGGIINLALQLVNVIFVNLFSK